MVEPTAPLQALSNAIAALHKQQFGRGPSRTWAEWAGPDSLLVVLDDVLLPAEIAMVQHGAAHRVAEQRLFLQRATAPQFVAAVEANSHREVVSFAGANDPEHDVEFMVYVFASAPRARDGSDR